MNRDLGGVNALDRYRLGLAGLESDASWLMTVVLPSSYLGHRQG